MMRSQPTNTDAIYKNMAIHTSVQSREPGDNQMNEALHFKNNTYKLSLAGTRKEKIEHLSTAIINMVNGVTFYISILRCGTKS